jgi:mRNA interferase MazF
VVPVTSNITRIYPFQLLLPAHLTGLPQDSKAQAEQIRSVSVDGLAGSSGNWPQPWWPTSTARSASSSAC